MDNNVSRVAANANFFIQGNLTKSAKKDEPKTEDKGQKAQNTQVNPDAIYNAMNMSGIQNMAMVAGANRVNPSDYLNQESIDSITAFMGNFEAASEEALAQMNAEFEGVAEWDNMSEANKLALAAQTYQEV